MKKSVLRFTLVSVVLLFAAVAVGAGKGDFKAKLSGGDETPAVKTGAKGEAVFHVLKNGTEMSYKLTVSGIENVTAAHVHMGKKGVEGPPVAGLFAGPKKEGKFSGVLAEGTLSDKDLMGSLSGKSIGDLVKLIKSGNTYVNVHTDKYPDGEIRGQIR
ncbi:MAG TPA: CHRD domain-containing protein [Geobacteraceae bacterium]|nr:CHRD domain-containing protein [Geobacteraceae bacterium]